LEFKPLSPLSIKNVQKHNENLEKTKINPSTICVTLSRKEVIKMQKYRCLTRNGNKFNTKDFNAGTNFQLNMFWDWPHHE